MEAKPASRSFLPVLIFFIIANAAILISRSLFEKWNVNTDVLIIGNLVLFFAAAVSFYMYYKSLRSKNKHAIVRMIYAGVLTKMLTCLIAVFIYISVAGKAINKEAIFGCMFLYIVYTTIEVSILMKLSKKNA